MNRIERVVRRALNPLSTRVTMLVQTPRSGVRIPLGLGRGFKLPFGRPLPRGYASYGPRSAEDGFTPLRLPWSRRRPISHLAPQPGRRPGRGRPTAAVAGFGRAGAGEVLMPNVIGSTVDDARAMLARIGLGAREPETATAVSLTGTVVNQYPDSGAVVPEGTVVTLWVHRGPGSAGVREPRRPRPDPRELRGEADEPAR